MRAKVFVIVLVMLMLYAFAANAGGPDQFTKDSGTKKPGNPKLEHMLDKMAVNPVDAAFLAKEYNINLNKENSVQVIIDLEKSGTQYLDALGRAGAVIEISDKNLVQARVPVSMLNAVADLPFVNHIREPEKHVPLATSEGVATINATVLQSLGFNGSGVKIAVVDIGFEGYTSKLGTELPSGVTVISFRSDGDITGKGEVHGTAVAETVHDVAPGAQLYLVNFATNLELNSAVDWLISQHVNIISASFGHSIGPKDGTDYGDGIVTKATAAGILWVNAAGNHAERHWMGNFYDPDGNGYHNFAGTDETQDIFYQAGESIDLFLDWDDWPYSNQDFDLYIYLPDLSGSQVSDNSQTGTQPPAEIISVGAPVTGYYKIKIKKYSATRNVKFHLFTAYNPTMQYRVAAGSITIPGTSKDALTIGATHWLNDALEPYSSQGPTDDGRIKPDVAAPSNTTNSVYGVFTGTSASAPHVSGAAALLLQINPNLSVNQLKQALESGARDLGAPGKDNQFGAGRIDIYRSALPFLPPTANGNITGSVTNSSSSLPIAGATVSAGGINAITSATGVYSISIAPGAYFVNASAPGFKNSTRPAVVTSGATVIQDFALLPDFTAGGTTVSISDAIAVQNGSIVLPIMIGNVNNLGAGTIRLNYDPNVASVPGVSAGDIGNVISNIDGITGMTEISAISTAPRSGNVAFANVRLRAVGLINSTSPLNLSVQTLIDQNGAAINYTLRNGTLTVSAVIKGDCSGDGSVNIVDALFVAQSTVGLRSLNPAQIAAADVNGDSAVNIVDALFIAQSTVGLRTL